MQLFARYRVLEKMVKKLAGIRHPIQPQLQKSQKYYKGNILSLKLTNNKPGAY